MPMLLEDLAEQICVSIQRVANRLDEEARLVEALQLTQEKLEELKRKTAEPARQATKYAISQLPQAEALWSSAIVAFRDMSEDDAKRLLRSFLAAFESGQRLCRTPQKLWNFVENHGASPEQLDRLEQTRLRFQELASEAKSALKQREDGWQPADAERLALGIQLASEGKTITSDQARARFHRLCRVYD